MVSVIGRVEARTDGLVSRTCLAPLPHMSYNVGMKSLTVRLPNEVVDRLEAEARRRKMSKSDIVRERLVMAEPHDTSKLHPADR